MMLVNWLIMDTMKRDGKSFQYQKQEVTKMSSFMKGRVYAITYEGVIHEFDTKIEARIRMCEEKSEIKLLHEFVYLNGVYMISTSGGLLLVERYFNYVNLEVSSCTRFYHTYDFKAFKLSQSGWTKVKSLGDYIIVLGLNSSTCHAVPSGKGNCIYYSNDRYKYHLG